MPDEAIRETNKAVARRILAAWNERGETHLPDELVSPQMVRHFPETGFAARAEGQPAGESVLPRDVFTNQRYTEEMVIADDRHVFIAWELRATHRGEMFGVQPTGREVVVFGSDVIRLADGKIIQHWDYYPKARIHAFAQLGLLDRDLQQRMIREGFLGRNRTTGQAPIDRPGEYFIPPQ